MQVQIVQRVFINIELRARFDLLTSFRQADMSVDGRYNAVQTQVALS